MSGGNLVDYHLDSQTDSLLLSLDSLRDGQLTVTLPRSYVDTSCTGLTILVLVDGKEIFPQKTITNSYRKLTIPFTLGSKMIEIINDAMCKGMPTGASPFLK